MPGGFTEWLKILLFGVIEGITEWLPVSSTGHLILAERLFAPSMSEAFMEMFRVVIQLGAILAVAVLYFRRLNPFSFQKSDGERRETWSLWAKIFVASIPAGIVGALFDDAIDSVFYNYVTVSLTLILYGIAFILIEYWKRGKRGGLKRPEDAGFAAALGVGLAQTLALIPGTSRSGATILAAMLLGFSRPAAAEFSFFLALPAMLGASALKIVKFGFDFAPEELAALLFGMAAAFFVSVLAIKFLTAFVAKRSFRGFGWYRIILGAAVLIYFSI